MTAKARRSGTGDLAPIDDDARSLACVRLGSPDLDERLSVLGELADLELRGRWDERCRIGPALPSYLHVHTTASYGFSVPGIFSVARMVWAAYEARATSIMIVEHESVAHFDEARQGVEIVNRVAKRSLVLNVGVEFKAVVAPSDPRSREFVADLAECLGQGEAAWVVGTGATPSRELSELVSRFQEAKRMRGALQLMKLNRYFKLTPEIELSGLLTPEGNFTDRILCIAVAKARWPQAESAALQRRAATIRKMLNPGGVAYVPFEGSLPNYQDLIPRLGALGMMPTFTAQLRGEKLAKYLPLLKEWGIRALDAAGIEPNESDADRSIRRMINLAEQHGMAFVGGSDYRGSGTGWTTSEPWMSRSVGTPNNKNRDGEDLGVTAQSEKAN